MKPTLEQLGEAVAEFSILKYFPADPMAKSGVIKLLARMVGTVEQLDWLVRTMVDRVGSWEGPLELRGVFCSRFKPADGIEADSSIPGFTPEDSEARQISQHVSRKEIGAPARLKLLPAPEDVEAIEKATGMNGEAALIHALKPLPDPTPADRQASKKLLGHLL